jgi:hypothetical protein
MSRQVLHTLLALVVSGVALLATAGSDTVAGDTVAAMIEMFTLLP